MKFTAIAIDDQDHALTDLTYVVDLVPRLNLIETFTDVSAALVFLSEKIFVDVIFCDVEMPGISGLEAASDLARHCDFLLFATGHKQYQARAMEIGIDGYLMKPVLADKINEKLDKLARLRRHGGMLQTVTRYLFFNEIPTGEQVKVQLDEVIAVITNSYTNAHIDIIMAARTLVVRSSLKAFVADTAVTTLFIQLNQNTLVAKAAISSIKDGMVFLHDDRFFAVSRRYAQAVEAYRRGSYQSY